MSKRLILPLDLDLAHYICFVVLGYLLLQYFYYGLRLNSHELISTKQLMFTTSIHQLLRSTELKSEVNFFLFLLQRAKACFPEITKHTSWKYKLCVNNPKATEHIVSGFTVLAVT